jgi:hypothetical protein
VAVAVVAEAADNVTRATARNREHPTAVVDNRRGRSV